MPLFEYKGMTSSGRQKKGTIDAESNRSARARLKQDGIFPTHIAEIRGANAQKTSSWNINIQLKRNSVGLTQLAIATRQFSTLVAAGMPIVESIRALCDQIEDPYFRNVFSEVGEEVNEGTTLANAMRKHEKVFPRLYVNMVASGEASGKLDLVLERLADLFESQAALRRKIYSALTYPILMLFICISVVAFLLGYVVPQITAIFEDQGMALPMPTQIVIGLSDFIRMYWLYILILGGVAVAAIKSYAKTDKGHAKIDQIKLRLPLFGLFTLKIATARFSRNLGTMLGSGIELLKALGIAKNIIGNVILEDAIDKVIDGVREGGSLAGQLKLVAVFPPLLIHMTAIGEKTGSLESLLIRAANSYESEVDAFVSGLTSILEPVLIVFLAGIVAGIIVSVMLPLLEMTSMTGI